MISHGIVVSFNGTYMRSFFACSTAFRIASGTSWAFPSPTPTWPFPSPTTTSAVNEKRRPPFTTLATRLIATTRSVSSSTLGSIFSSATHSSSQAVEKGPSAAKAFLGGGHAPLPNLPQLARAKPALEGTKQSLVVATYIQVRLTPHFLAALHLDLFEQPALAGCFSNALATVARADLLGQ